MEKDKATLNTYNTPEKLSENFSSQVKKPTY